MLCWGRDVAKDIVAKEWELIANFDGTLDSLYQSGDKPNPDQVVAPTIAVTATTATSITISITGGDNIVTLRPRLDGVLLTAIAVDATTYTYSGLDIETEYTIDLYVGGDGGPAYSNEIVETTATNSWLLQADHYEPSKAEPIIIHPRPDAETNSDERHRLAPAGRRWSCPINIYSGSWPFYFAVDATSASKGIAVGAFLEPVGDELAVGDTYGEVYWDNPIIGSHTITVTIKTQEHGRNTSGFADELTLTFTLVVADKNDTSKFVWISGTGNDTTGTGSFDAPFRTLNKVFGGTSYSGRQCHMKSGTFNTDASAKIGVGNSDRPRVLWGDYADHGSITINYTQQNMGVYSPGCFVGGFSTSEGGYGASVANSRMITVQEGVDRWTFHRINSVNPSNGTTGNDNPTLIFSTGGSGAAEREYGVISRCVESGRPYTANSAGTYVLFSASLGVSEFNTDTSDANYTMFLKDSNRKWSVRGNTVIKPTAGMSVALSTGCQMQNFPTADIEISYNKTNAEIRANLQWVNSSGAHHIFRNSGSDGIAISVPEELGTGPYYVEKNAVEGTITTGTRVATANNLNASSGVIDSSLNLEPAYAAILGTRGAQVA
jgi:hypothetical protein